MAGDAQTRTKGRIMAYVLLAIAIACEIGATTALKYTNGFTVLLPTLATLALYFASFFLFSKVLTQIDLAAGYATWCAVGIIATSAISVFVFGDHLNPPALVGIAMLVVGVVLVNMNVTQA